MKRYYQILELPLNASPRRIKTQYRRLAKRYHPDRTADLAQKARFTEKFREINQAYEALSKIVQRASLSPVERKLDFLYQTGCLLVEQRHWARALMVFNEILAINPAYRDTLTRLREARHKHRQLCLLYTEADTLFGQKRWSEAMVGFEALLRQAPNYRDADRKLRVARREQLMQDFIKKC